MDSMSERSADVEAAGADDGDVEMDNGKSATTFFWGGIVLTLFMSVFSLLALCLHPELRSSKRRIARYLCGVVVACFVHGAIAAVFCVVLFWRQRRYA